MFWLGYHKHLCAIVSSILDAAAQQSALAQLDETLWAGRLGAGQTLVLMTVCHHARTPETSVIVDWAVISRADARQSRSNTVRRKKAPLRAMGGGISMAIIRWLAGTGTAAPNSPFWIETQCAYQEQATFLVASQRGADEERLGGAHVRQKEARLRPSRSEPNPR